MVALPIRWRRDSFAYKMAAFLGVYLQDGGVPTRWRRYEQDGGFTHKMATRQFCLQDDGVSGNLPTRWWCTYKMTMFLRVLPSEATHVTIKK